MTSKYKVYNPNRSCPKCGYPQVEAIWHADGYGGEEPGDFIERSCPNCEFGWIEVPLDRAHEAAPEHT